MPEEVYVYSKPKPAFPKKILLAVPVVLAVVIIFMVFSSMGGSKAPNIIYTSGDGSSYTVSVPSGLKGQEGLNYIKTNSQDSLNGAWSACINNFAGVWSNTPEEIGCFNMQGFDMNFCGFPIIADLADLCLDIGGVYECSSTQAFCRLV